MPRLYMNRIRLRNSLMATFHRCRAAATSRTIKLKTLDESFDVLVDFNDKDQFKFDSGVGTRKTVFCNSAIEDKSSTKPSKRSLVV